MEIRIKNGLLEGAMELLFNLELRGKQSRHRTKFIKRLNEQLTEVKEQKMDLIKEHSNLDEEGNPKIIGDVYDIIDLDAFNRDIAELAAEELIFTSPVDEEMIKTIKQILDDCDVALSGQQAVVYDELCEAFDTAFAEEEK
ncbi:hypothetical protein SFC08_14715 [Lysinibacillus halotolerans]